MINSIVPQVLIYSISGFHFPEKRLDRYSQIPAEPECPDICLQTSLFSAITGKSVRHNAHMTELGTPVILTVPGCAAEKDRTADAVFKMQINKI